MIKKALLLVAAIVAVILIAAAFKSPDFHVERSLAIAASPNDLYTWANSHKKFNEWNPFLKVEPAAKVSYSGAETGVGAVSSWEGKEIGKGQATIVESKPGELVRLRMDWLAPMEGTSTVDFTFKPQGDKTLVTWAMYGRNTSYMMKVMSLFMNCDSICGAQFEKGLANLSQLATTAPAPVTASTKL